MLFYNRVLKASGKFLRYDKATRNSLFSTDNVAVVSKHFSFESVLTQLPINVMGNAFLF